MNQMIAVESIDSIVNFHRSSQRDCPVCDRDCSRTALTLLAYTFTTCSTCNVSDFEHLIEQVWHRACLADDARRALSPSTEATPSEEK